MTNNTCHVVVIMDQSVPADAWAKLIELPSTIFDWVVGPSKWIVSDDKVEGLSLLQEVIGECQNEICSVTTLDGTVISDVRRSALLPIRPLIPLRMAVLPLQATHAAPDRPFVYSKAEIQAITAKLTQDKGRGIVHRALNIASELLGSQWGTIILILNDLGSIESFQNAKRIAAQLRQRRAHRVVVLGLNPAHRAEFNELAFSLRHALIGSPDRLRQQLAELDLWGPAPVGFELTIFNADFHSRSLEAELTIHNQKQLDLGTNPTLEIFQSWFVPADESLDRSHFEPLTMQLQPTIWSSFKKALLGGSWSWDAQTIRITLLQRAVSNDFAELTLPPYLDVELVTPNQIFHAQVPLQINWWQRVLKSRDPPSFMWGGNVGAGKSTGTTSLRIAIHPHATGWPQIAATSSFQQSSFTSLVASYPEEGLFSIYDVPGKKVPIGYDEVCYMGFVCGYLFDFEGRSTKNVFEAAAKTSTQNRRPPVNFVLYALPANSIKNNDMEPHLKVFKMLKSIGMPFAVALTHWSTIYDIPHLAEELRFMRHPSLKQRFTNFTNLFEISESQVFPLTAYTDVYGLKVVEKDFNRDWLAFRILRYAIQQSKLHRLIPKCPPPEGYPGGYPEYAAKRRDEYFEWAKKSGNEEMDENTA